MKFSLFLIIPILLFSGCLWFSAPQFNETEYHTYITIESLAGKRSCDADTIKKIAEESHFLRYYTYHLPNNLESAQAALDIAISADELFQRFTAGKYTPQYCDLKLLGIELMAGTILDQVGKKVR